MSKKAKILADLYRRKKITKEGLQKAIEDGLLSRIEYAEIVGLE